jgi:hypothetical protein
MCDIAFDSKIKRGKKWTFNVKFHVKGNDKLHTRIFFGKDAQDLEPKHGALRGI